MNALVLKPDIMAETLPIARFGDAVIMTTESYTLNVTERRLTRDTTTVPFECIIVSSPLVPNHTLPVPCFELAILP
ncbi:unnamed protein product [Colias eurytheme]|nr:unnamed protein product [Colias eurytheme]